MASYRHLPPPPPLSLSAKNPIHQRQNNNQFNQNWNYGFPQSYNHNNQYHRQHHYPPPPPPPPPPPSPMPYPPNHYSQHRHQQPPLPPLPRSSPPPPTPHQNKENELHDRKSKDIPHRQHKNAGVPPMSGKKLDRKRRAETEEDTRLRKKREYEKQRQLKKSQNIILQKIQKKQGHGQGSVIGSRMRERKVAPLLSAERAENKLNLKRLNHACPVHATNKDLCPIEVLPLLLDFYLKPEQLIPSVHSATLLCRYDDQFVVAAFDNDMEEQHRGHCIRIIISLVEAWSRKKMTLGIASG